MSDCLSILDFFIGTVAIVLEGEKQRASLKKKKKHLNPEEQIPELNDEEK